MLFGGMEPNSVRPVCTRSLRQIHPFINQKVFLLQTDHSIDMLDILILKQIDNAGGLLADRFH